MKHSPATLRKAAILVASLDKASAQSLLRDMGDERAALVRRAIHELGDIDPDEQDQIIREFVRGGAPAVRYAAAPGGVELELGSTQRMPDVPAPKATVRPANNEDPFAFLNDVDADLLVPFLEREHPQTVAVVVAHLPRQRAAETLARLETNLQLDVLRRLSDLEETDREIVREIETALQNWIADHARRNRRQKAGLETVGAILAAADASARRQLLGALSTNADPLARHFADKEPEAVEPSPVEYVPACQLSFEEVSHLDDRSLMKVLQAADVEVVTLALAGAKAAMVERVMRQLSGEQARLLRQALTFLGPTRLSDVEQAQDELASLASQLVSAGQIELVERPLAVA